MNKTKRQLSEPRQRFLELMGKMNFCQIKNLQVLGGDPILNPPPEILQGLKFGGDNAPRPESNLSDFALKDQHHRLFEMFDSVGNGTIDVIQVRYGLPFRADVSRIVT